MHTIYKHLTETQIDHDTFWRYMSEDDYFAAESWYNSTPKAEIVAYCASHGVDLHEPGETTLVDDWADIAMHTWAKANGHA